MVKSLGRYTLLFAWPVISILGIAKFWGNSKSVVSLLKRLAWLAVFLWLVVILLRVLSPELARMATYAIAYFIAAPATLCVFGFFPKKLKFMWD